MISIGIVEDDSDVREGICAYLNAQPDICCILDSDSVEGFLHHLAKDYIPDVILMDIGLPGMSGISGIKLIKEKYPDVDIIMLTVHNDPHRIFQSLCAGASGYLLKTTPFAGIKKALEELHAGGAPMSPQIARKVIDYFHPADTTKNASVLTDKEKGIVMGLVDGLSYKMIADQQNISLETVRTHIKNIYHKLHVHCKADVIRKSLSGEL